jgi:hypothetical protein
LHASTGGAVIRSSEKSELAGQILRHWSAQSLQPATAVFQQAFPLARIVFVLDAPPLYVSEKRTSGSHCFDDEMSAFGADDFASWNSTLFTSIPFKQLPVAVVTKDFLQMQDNWTLSGSNHSDDALQAGQKASILDLRSKAVNFQRMTNIECM